MKKFIICIAAALSCLVLASCETGPDQKHIAKMESYIGRSEREIIMDWGVPDKVYNLNGRTKVISYRKESYYTDNSGFGLSTCAGSFPGRFGYSTCVDPIPTPSRTTSYVCEMSFNIVEGKAVGWFQNGNSCPRIK